MPAPKTPNTEAARIARSANVRRRKLEAAAALLREAGECPNCPPARAASLMSRATKKREEELRSARVMLREAGHLVLAPDEVAWIRANADASVLTFIRGMVTESAAPLLTEA